MNLMHLTVIAAFAVLGPGPEVSGFPLATPSTAATIGGGDKKVALAIDGGGMRGILSASILKRVEKSIQYQTQDPERRIGQSFDIIAGTSTGGILATYFSAPELEGTAAGAIGFYKKNAQKIFGKPPHPFMRKLGKGKWWGIKSPGLLGLAQRAATGLPRHSDSGLDAALSEFLPDLTFSELANWKHSDVGRNPSLFLVSYDVKYRRPVAFVADRYNTSTFFLSQEPLSIPFFPPYQSTSGFVGLFSDDKKRLHSVINRWIIRFKRHGEFYDKQNCTEGFVQGFINWFKRRRESTKGLVKRWDNWFKHLSFVKRWINWPKRRGEFTVTKGFDKRWIDWFKRRGKVYVKKNCTVGFKFGPVNFLGDSQFSRDEVISEWQVLQSKNFDKISLNGKNPDAITKKNYICFAQTNLDDLKVWQAARASSSAPTFFLPMKIDNFYRRGWDKDNKFCDNAERMEPGFFCDGGIVANNPGLQALLYLMAHDQSILKDMEKNTKDVNAKCDITEAVDCGGSLQELPKNWEEYNKISHPNPLDNYALLSIGSGSTFDSANVDSMAGSELWWVKQEAQSGNLISLLIDNLQMIAHANLRTLFSLAGRENAYLRIQYRTKKFGNVPEHFDESLRKMDDPSDSTMKDYEDLGDYIADMYAGAIDQFVFLHILTKKERDEFIAKHSATATEVFNGIPIADDELDSWKSISGADTAADTGWLLFIIASVISVLILCYHPFWKRKRARLEKRSFAVRLSSSIH